MDLLTDKSVIHYLLEKGVLTTDEVVMGNITVIPAQSRNKCWKVIVNGTKGYFVKQPISEVAEKIMTINTELAFANFLLHAPEAQTLVGFIPQPVRTDYMRKVIVSTLLMNSEDRSEFHLRTKKFPKSIGKKSGDLLATIHQTDVSQLSSYLRHNIPWIFEIGTGRKEMFNATTVADFQLLQLVQENREFVMSISALKKQWQGNALLHGDMKWQNILIDSNTPDKSPELKFIDWELASIGDPCWDVAGIVQSYLTCWVHHFKQNSGAKITDIEATETIPLEHFQDSIRSFWLAYCIGMRWNENTASKMLIKTTGYAAVRIIQSCLESTHYQKNMIPNSARLLQLSMNMLRNPAESASSLFGIYQTQYA